MSPTQRSGLTALAVATLLASINVAHAALTTPTCLAKKLGAWGNLRKCQAGENGKALQGKPSEPAKCKMKFDLKLATLNGQATAAAIACRYGVNGDGTVTDYDTGLMWEQKTDDGSVHDKDNVYSWSPSAGLLMDGTASTLFLETLNSCVSSDGVTVTGGFATHCDWRLPSIEELAGVVDLGAPGCGSGSPCIDQGVFGPTVAYVYWTATTAVDISYPHGAWDLYFFDGSLSRDFKGDDLPVRAVRAGL
jgi:hypothetical protein